MSRPIVQAKKPAVALYKFWDHVLTFQEAERSGLGDAGWGIQREVEGVISLGQRGGYSGFDPHFYLRKDGAFALNTMWGYYRRDVIRRNVPFLGYSHVCRRYQWFPDLTQSRRGWANLNKWDDPIPYISEAIFTAHSYYSTMRWIELAKVDGEWKFQLARKQTALSGKPHSKETVANLHRRWQQYEQLVAKRYLRAEQRARGNTVPVSARPPTLRAGRETVPEQQAVSRLLAHLEVGRPAKTNPLLRPKEARHGADHMAPTNQL